MNTLDDVSALVDAVDLVRKKLDQAKSNVGDALAYVNAMPGNGSTFRTVADYARRNADWQKTLLDLLTLAEQLNQRLGEDGYDRWTPEGERDCFDVANQIEKR